MMTARRGGGKRKRGTNKETEKKNGNVSNKKWRVTKPQQDKETEEYLKRNNFQHCLDKDQEYIFVNVPTVVVIESNTEPSKELAIKSLQSATEEGTITMRTGRVPYIPLQERDRQVEKTSSRIFTLFCNNRRAALRNKKEERVEKFEYCLPYFSESEEDDTEGSSSTEVYIMFPSDPPVTCLLTQCPNLKGCLRN
ncbi:protein HEAT INTOLERANT 4 [Brassica rapa]|uniref:protein HEAT INTOLERANT 4 n=1 Tax=Brassica campestris TaxID=3711 RepID=UPI0004F1C1BB|nr:protein HEAT INTOLERANT 4 [Brassica rapa]